MQLSIRIHLTIPQSPPPLLNQTALTQAVMTLATTVPTPLVLAVEGELVLLVELARQKDVAKILFRRR